jgi:hypothetical protein
MPDASVGMTSIGCIRMLERSGERVSGTFDSFRVNGQVLVWLSHQARGDEASHDARAMVQQPVRGLSAWGEWMMCDPMPGDLLPTADPHSVVR